MISENSESYPYLSIARRFGVPYGDVLGYTDRIASGVEPPRLEHSQPWQGATWKAWERQQAKAGVKAQ